MNVFTLYVLNVLLICFENIMTAYMGNCFFTRRWAKRSFIPAVCILLVLNTAAIIVFGDTLAIKLAVTIAIQAAWLSIVFRANVVSTVFTVILLTSYWTVMDSLLLLLVTLYSESAALYVSADPFAYYLMCFIAKVLELLGIVILHTCCKQRLKVRIAWTNWLQILFFPTTSLLIALELYHMFTIAPELSGELLACCGILLAADMMSVFLLDYLEQQRLAFRDNTILRQNLKSERESIAAWISAYREERRHTHDFQNQLSVLRGLVDENAPSAQLLPYIDGLLNTTLPQTRYIDTNRPVADVLLSQKAAIAKSRQIAFQMQLDDMSRFPLSDDELVVVLANLLDNAITACEKVSDPEQRVIRVNVQCRAEAAFFCIENSTAQPVMVKENRVISSDRKEFSHGFGLRNVASILEAYDAAYLLEYREDQRIFCVSAQIVNPIS